MKKLITLTLLLVVGTVTAQETNIFWDRDFWGPDVTIKDVMDRIEAGNDPARLDLNGFDAITNAILANTTNDVIEYLLKLDGNDIDKITHDGRTYLFWAALRGNLPLMEYLINEGAKTDLLDDKGSTVLLFAASGGQTNPELYDLLLKHGASVKETNPKGANALHNLVGRAKRLGDLDYFIQKGLDLNSVDKAGHNVVDYAARTGNKEIIGQLIKKGIPYKDVNKDGSNAMLMAAYGSRSTNNLVFFKYLDSLGIAADKTDSKGVNPVHNLAFGNKDLAIYDFFIERGASVSKADNSGNTPLMNAANRNDLEIVQYLIQKTGDINAKNREGKSALTNAVRQNSPEVVALLVDKGADIDVVDNEDNDLAFYLVDSYSKRNEKAFNVKWDILAKKGLNLNRIQSEGNNLFHLAAGKNSTDLLDKIARTKSDINLKNDNGLTPLHLAAMTADNLLIIKHLIELGAKPSVLTEFEESAYDLALENELLDKNKVEFLKI